MTVHHFIAANKELQVGTFGTNAILKPISEVNLRIVGQGTKREKRNKYKDSEKQKEQYAIVYETIEDTYGFSIFDSGGYKKLVQHKFTNPYIYELTWTGDERVYRELFTYINIHLEDNEKIELYSCLDGHEHKPRNPGLDIVINLKTLNFTNYIGHYTLDEKSFIQEISQRFWFREYQYVVVSK
jgi:hypothetical protein